MNLHIKQDLLKGYNYFTVMDDTGKVIYIAKNPDKTVMVGLELDIYDVNNNKIASINQKGLSLNPTFRVFSQDVQIATIKKKFTMFKPQYVVEELNWEIKGDFLAHEYVINNGLGVVAKIHKELFNFIDTFVLELEDPSQVITALACVFVIDEIVDNEGNGWTIK